MRPLFLAPITLVAATALAAAPKPATPPRDTGLQPIFIASFDHQSTADLKDGAAGTVRRDRLGYELIGTGWITPTTRLDLDYEAKFTDNTWSGPSAPYCDTRSHFFGAKAGHLLDSTSGVGLVTAVEFAAENGVRVFADDVRGGIGPTFIWLPSPALTTETGVTLQTQFGRGPVASPYVKWVWSTNKHLDLEARATGLQNGVAATWFVTENKATSVRISLFYETALYALRETRAAEGVSIGEIPLRVTLTQFFSKNFFIAARAESILAHKERFYRDDRQIANFGTARSASVGLLTGWRF